MKQANNNFSVGFYFQSLAKVLGEPGAFFRELQDTGLKQPLGFLLVSSAFFAGASLLTRPSPGQILNGSILFINAVGMPFIAAGLGYMLMTLFFGKIVTFSRLFSIYAFAAGVTLLASWIPLFIWLTEPWKWVLIGMGLTKSCDFRWNQTVVVIGGSIGVMVLFFRSLLPFIS